MGLKREDGSPNVLKAAMGVVFERILERKQSTCKIMFLSGWVMIKESNSGRFFGALSFH